MDMKKSAFDICIKAPSLLTVKRGNAVRHLLLLIYAFTCTALFSCSSKEYKDIVPKDSPAIARINLSALKNDAQLSDEQASAFVKKVIPFAPGLDLSQPVYAFVSPGRYFGFLFSVDDGDVLKKSIMQAAEISSPKEGGGLEWAVWKGSWQMAWNNDALLMLGPVSTSERAFVTRTMAAMFNSDEGMSDGNLYPRIEAMDEDVAIAANADVLPSVYGKLLALPLGKNADLSDIRIVTGVTLKGNEIRLSNVLESKQDNITLTNDGFLKPYEGLFKPVANANTPIVALMGINGNELYKQLSSNKDINMLLMALSMDFSIDKITKNINGDVAVRLNGLDSSGKPDVTINAAVGNGNAVRKIFKQDKSSVRSSDGYSRRMNTGRSFDFWGKYIEICYSDKGILTCTNEIQQPHKDYNKSDTLTNGNSNFNAAVGKLCYVHVNCPAMSNLEFTESLLGGKISEILHGMEYLEFSLSDATHSQLVIRLNNNILSKPTADNRRNSTE